MATNYPTSLDDGTSLPEPTTGATIPAAADTNRSQAIKAIQAKIGIGDSAATTATDGFVMTADGAGASAWEAIPASTPEGTAVKSTGVTSGYVLQADGDDTSSWVALSGGGDMLAATYDAATVAEQVVGLTAAQTLTNKTLSDSTTAIADNTDATKKIAFEASGITTGTTRTITMADANIDLANVPSAAEKTVLGNTSGTNTGDQDLSTYQVKPAEGAFVDGDKTKLDGIEAAADVTATANVTAAGALMDSEVTNLADVKAFDPADYATAAQGATADTATQPGDLGTVAALDSVDEDDMASNSATLIPTQQSVKAYVDANAGGGGGNPYGADIVVAASGGDYTTLGAAIDAATAGQVIYVEPGTYVDTTNPATEADSLTIIGASKETAIIQINTAAWNLDASNLSIRNIKFEITSGNLTINSVGFDMANCWVYCSSAKTSGVGFLCGQDKSRVTNCLFESLGQGTSTSGGDFQFANTTVANNTFDMYATRTFGNLRSNGSNTYTGNYFWAKGGTKALFRTGATDQVIGNWFKGFSTSTSAVAITVGSNDCLVSGNMITRIEKGIQVDSSSDCVIVGNQIDQDSGDDVGIEITSSSNCVISSNRVSFATTGINITDSGSTSNLVMGNVLTGCTTGLSDSGTTTTSANNVGA